MSAVLLSLALLFQGLTYNPHTWWFEGQVTEVRQIQLLGRPAQIAKVQAADFEAWVIQRMDEGPFEVVLGTAQVGELVRISIAGPHVSRTRVDWALCQPADSNYCRLGAFYDDGLLALDWNIPLSPSNTLIHLGHPNPSWRQPLFWETHSLEQSRNNQNADVAARTANYNVSRLPEKPGTGCQGCSRLCGANLCAIPGAEPGKPGDLCGLVEVAITRSHPWRNPGRNRALAAFHTARACPV